MIGSKDSCVAGTVPSSTPVITVGSKKKPFVPTRLPPHTRVAPSFTAVCKKISLRFNPPILVGIRDRLLFLL